MMKIVEVSYCNFFLNSLQICWFLFYASVSIFFITWSNIAESLKFRTIFNSGQKELLKNVKDLN